MVKHTHNERSVEVSNRAASQHLVVAGGYGVVGTGVVGATFEHPLSFEKLDRAKFLPAMIASYGGDLHPLITQLSHLRSE
jgi:hypothetical protein